MLCLREKSEMELRVCTSLATGHSRCQPSTHPSPIYLQWSGGEGSGGWYVPPRRSRSQRRPRQWEVAARERESLDEKDAGSMRSR